jgi:hypothetical protein
MMESKDSSCEKAWDVYYYYYLLVGEISTWHSPSRFS